ncbi:UDP-N-acetylenolpyruvoylglucosamine reductase [hydrothermal vent metagenome]|uniref:UDP-N-acetylmuramate dehydrogenase n=1 Tax=hydrothermal vent metagenome TaxID=652676 RepID=A0A3B1E166_9ZZZZ
MQLQESIKKLNHDNLPFILIGGGSNLLISDHGIDFYVIHYFSESPIITQNGNELTVSGSTLLDDLVIFAADQGLEGINVLSGIPGTVGGAVVGNAGAFGKQIGDVLIKSTLITPQVEIKEVTVTDLNFSYRNSILRKSQNIVLSITLLLSQSDKTTLYTKRKDILKLRHEKHPNLKTHPCAGSFFRNIEPTSAAEKRQAAGWFLEQAGAHDLKCGEAYVFPKHANIITHHPSASAQEVYDLSLEMAQKVKDQFDLDLVREVCCIGKFKRMPDGIKNLVW